jgi:hypothetical protein
MALEDNAELILGLLGPHTVQTVTAASTTAGTYTNANGYPVVVAMPVATAGTVAISVAPDGVTWTVLEAARTVAASGAPAVTVTVPPGWFLKIVGTTTVVGNGNAY